MSCDNDITTFPISVVITTFNQDIKKIIETISSAIKQEGIDFEIIVTDDGSAEHYTEQLHSFFSENGFHNYELLEAKENVGTVKNLLKALAHAKGKYIKFISPGDMLLGSSCLQNWYAEFSKTGYRWSFGDAVFYSGDYPDRKSFEHRRVPYDVRPYQTNNTDLIRWNYAVLKDNAVGQAILCERELMLEYLNRICDFVRIGEDNIYRMMMFDGIIGYYYPHDVILYEFGSGVSTNNQSSNHQRMLQEGIATDEYLERNAECEDAFARNAARALKTIDSRKWRIPFVKHEFNYRVYRRVSDLKTNTYDIESDPFFA